MYIAVFFFKRELASREFNYLLVLRIYLFSIDKSTFFLGQIGLLFLRRCVDLRAKTNLIYTDGTQVDFTNVIGDLDITSFNILDSWSCPHQECRVQLDIMLGMNYFRLFRFPLMGENT